MENNTSAAARVSGGALLNLKKWFAYKWVLIKRSRIYYALVAPYALLFSVFIILPVGISMVLSFTNFNVLEPPDFIGLDNYYRLFINDEIFIVAIKNTLVLSAITGPVGYLLCLLLAWLINELPPKLRAFLTLLFYTPALAGGAVYTVWIYIFSADQQGFINSRLIRWGLVVDPIAFLKDEKYIMPTVILVMLWLSLGVSFLSFIGGLQGVDRSLYEAGAIDGIKNRWQELWFITLPSMRSQMLFGAVMSITGSFGMGSIITALVGFPSPNYAVHTIVHHLEDYGNIRFEMGYASAIATVLFLIMIFANRIVQNLLRKVGS